MDGGAAVGTTYPGALAPPDQILRLAESYAEAARRLYAAPKPRTGLWHAPFRLCALHSIELYINAFLRFRGTAPDCVRARLHDCWHAEFATVLDLRAGTRRHLQTILEHRDYLCVRYAPETARDWVPVNRVHASLSDIMAKSRLIPFHA